MRWLKKPYSRVRAIYELPVLIIVVAAGLLVFNSCNLSSPGGQLNGQTAQANTTAPDGVVTKSDTYMSLSKNAKVAPEFSIETTNGTVVTLSSLKGKVVLIDFWATYCGPCREALMHLEKLHKKYGSQGLVIIGASTDSDKNGITAFAQGYNLSFIMGMANDKMYSDYPFRDIPHAYLIDRNGKLFADYRGYGPLVERELDIDVEALLKK